MNAARPLTRSANDVDIMLISKPAAASLIAAAGFVLASMP